MAKHMRTRIVAAAVVAVAGIAAVTVLAALHDIPAATAVTAIAVAVGAAGGHGVSLGLVRAVYTTVTTTLGHETTATRR